MSIYRFAAVLTAGFSLLSVAAAAPIHKKTAPPPPAQEHAPYRDKTGDSYVDRLNAAQLPQNYKGPVYYAGQPVPKFQAVPRGQLNDLPKTTTAPQAETPPHP